MAFAVARRAANALENDIPRSSRDQVLARYRRLREISKDHHHESLKFISGDALLHQARRLGLADGKTLILDHMDEMYYVYDLVIHTAPAGRSRAIDRYSRSARFTAGSDEALVLAAMRAARFSILAIERRHEVAGLIAIDLFRRAEVWLVDVGLESSIRKGGMMATRLFTAEGFSMTTGVNVPFAPEAIEDFCAELPRSLGDGKLATLIDDRRLAEAIYRGALADGITDRVAYQDVPGDT
jgi:hypothetical protein